MLSSFIIYAYAAMAFAFFTAGLTVWLARDFFADKREAKYLTQSCMLGAALWPVILVMLLMARYLDEHVADR